MNTVTDEFGSNLRFETIEFCVDGDGGNPNFVFVAFVGMIDAGRATEHDFEHQRHEKSRKAKYARIVFRRYPKTVCRVVRRGGVVERGFAAGRRRGIFVQNGRNLVVGTHIASFQVRRVKKWGIIPLITQAFLRWKILPDLTELPALSTH